MGSAAPGECRTVCNRWAQVTMLATASNHIATCSAQGSGNTGRSDSPAPTSAMISRSGRSMKPPSPRSPLASARALM